MSALVFSWQIWLLQLIYNCLAHTTEMCIIATVVPCIAVIVEIDVICWRGSYCLQLCIQLSFAVYISGFLLYFTTVTVVWLWKCVLWMGVVKLTCQKYVNPFTCVRIIANQRWDVFLRCGVGCVCIEACMVMILNVMLMLMSRSQAIKICYKMLMSHCGIMTLLPQTINRNGLHTVK